MVFFSKKEKKVILIELTCPCKENMDEWHSIKLGKCDSPREKDTPCLIDISIDQDIEGKFDL